MNVLGITLDILGNECRLFMMGNRNGWAENLVTEGITRAFQVSGENENRSMIDFCA